MSWLAGKRSACLVGAALLLNGPALAIDIGGNIGGGVSVGGGPKVGGGGVSVGAGVAVGGGGVSASGGAPFGNATAGIEVTPLQEGVPPAGRNKPRPRTASSTEPISLPSKLIPTRTCVPGDQTCGPRLDDSNEAWANTALTVQPTAPLAMVTACRNQIIESAQPFDRSVSTL